MKKFNQFNERISLQLILLVVIVLAFMYDVLLPDFKYKRAYMYAVEAVVLLYVFVIGYKKNLINKKSLITSLIIAVIAIVLAIFRDQIPWF